MDYLKDKNITILVPSFGDAAPEKVALSHALFASNLGAKVSIVYVKNNKFHIYNREVISNITIKKINLFSLFKSDIIISHGFIPNFITSILTKMPFLNIKFFAFLHTNPNYDLRDKNINELIKKIAKFIWIKSLRSHCKIFSLNTDCYSFLDRRKVIIVRNGINKDNDVGVYNKFSPTEKIDLVSFCVIRNVKGLDQVIKAMSINPNISYTIIGDGPELKSIQKLAKELNVESRCNFLGYIKNPINLLFNFDIMIMPSRSEGFPLSLIEAMSIGMPCVTSNINAFSYHVSNCVEMFEVDNINSLIEAVRITNLKRKELSANSILMFNKYFTEKSAANYFFSKIQDVLNANSKK